MPLVDRYRVARSRYAWLARLDSFCLGPLRRYQDRQVLAGYSRLSLAETFDLVYTRGLWRNGQTGEDFSGEGSRGPWAEHYCALMRGEIERRGTRSLADLGCGDFAIGAKLAHMVDAYVGVDIVERVVAANQRRYGSANRRFLCADLTRDRLPAADAAIVRQVLQHLSNTEIHAVLNNVVRTYGVVFVTEHVHEGAEVRPNVDMGHGPQTRVERTSGVLIDRPPFQAAARVVADIPYKPGEFLRTWVIGRQERDKNGTRTEQERNGTRTGTERG
jgi:hypothetical protein